MPPSVAIRAGVDRKEQPRVAQIRIQLFARDARLDHAVGVCMIHRQHFVHAREIDADAAIRRTDMTFERSPAPNAMTGV
jgi:hypothetical protein